jgi:hypothetical protein
MDNPKMLRGQARRCRALMKTVMEPEVIEQLRLWAVELAEEADDVERASGGFAAHPRHVKGAPRTRGRSVRAAPAPGVAPLRRR